MLVNTFLSAVALLLVSFVPSINASLSPKFHSDAPWQQLSKRTYFPAMVDDYYTIKTPTNVTIRYKMPSEEGVCETTPGVNSYSGYVDLSEGMQQNILAARKLPLTVF